MLDTIIQHATAFGADTWKTMSLLAELAWSWIRQQPLWLTLGLGALLKAAVPAMLLVRWWRKKRAAKKETMVRPSTPPLTNTPVQTAAVMAARGVAPIEIARQTRLSRDAVALVTRQDRPLPAGVAGDIPVPPQRRQLVAHA